MIKMTMLDCAEGIMESALGTTDMPFLATLYKRGKTAEETVVKNQKHG